MISMCGWRIFSRSSTMTGIFCFVVSSTSSRRVTFSLMSTKRTIPDSRATTGVFQLSTS